VRAALSGKVERRLHDPLADAAAPHRVVHRDRTKQGAVAVELQRRARDDPVIRARDEGGVEMIAQAGLGKAAGGDQMEDGRFISWRCPLDFDLHPSLSRRYSTGPCRAMIQPENTMRSSAPLFKATLAVALLGATIGVAAQAPTAKGRTGLDLASRLAKWTGDLDGMEQRRTIRVLTSHNRTLYFIDKGIERGTAADQGRLLETELNKTMADGHLKVSVIFVPVSRDELLPALMDGRGDIVMGNLTITPERQKRVDFVDPWIANVDEIVVTGPEGPPIASLDSLSGQEVFVRESSSYYESLVTLNADFATRGLAPAILVPAPEELEDEDLLEMAAAGLVKVVVVDNHKAWFWQRVIPSLKLYPSVALRKGADVAWAIRKDSPKLKAALNAFLATNGKHSLNGRMIFRRYLLNTQYVKSATAEAEMKRFRQLIAYFRKYGSQYNLDWMLMAAQGYQESRLNQQAKSHVGAIGVMQIMPATGKELKVGDISQTEANIHGGVKYVRFMIDRYYKDEPMDDLNKGLFALAAYNCGPGRVRQLRREAAARGLDGNVWFDNVERIAAEKIGRETVTYVSNIYKYYVSYLLVQGEYIARRELKKKPASGSWP
jgi:membrane-bound lytic murein transglycosylase MltF